MLELCPRKYAWVWIDYIPSEGTYYTQFGTRVHKILENYYKFGIMPDLNEPEGNCAVALLAHLPPPQPGMRIEERRYVGRFEGSPDLTLGAAVWDHKTTSDLKWAKTPAGLLDDLQACLYAHFVMQETGELRVRMQWNYVTRSRPRVLPVIQEATFGAIVRTLDRAHALADEADRILAQKIPALELPPNPMACDMYGGCVHRARCNLSPGNRLEGLMNMTNASDFQAQMNATHPPAPPAPAPADPTANWTRQNGYRLNPGTNTWEPDAPPVAPPAPPAPPPAAAPVAVPINPPVPAAPQAPVSTLAGWIAPRSAYLTGAEAHTFLAPLAAAPSAESPYDRLAHALEAAADAVRELGGKKGPGRPRKVK